MLRNDVANEVRNDAMFATHVRRHIICEAYIIGEANIICRRQTSFKKRQNSVEFCRFLLVREAGVEPARPEWTLEPESSESANSTTRAYPVV